MKDFLIFVLFILMSTVLWAFSTALVETGKGNTRIAFIGRSVFYWMAVLIAFILGCLTN